MLHPRQYAADAPDRICAIEAQTGRTRSYGDLEVRANQIAHLCRVRGLEPGATIAFLTHDRLEVFDIAWAAQRAGLYFLPVYWNLSVDDTAWMIDHADTRILFYEDRFAGMARAIAAKCLDVALVSIDSELKKLVHGLPSTPVDREMRGLALQYTGGTTGRPKGVRRPINGDPVDTPDILLSHSIDRWDFSPAMRFSTTAPMYHVAPLKLNMIVHALGGTSVLLGDFEARRALADLEAQRVTHSHWVPDMFVDLIKLPISTRAAHDLSSMKCAIHAAAPCPSVIKAELIDWWGPIVHEIYAGTEGVGFCMIGPDEWARKQGSVGRSVIAVVHILRSDGSEADAGEVGEIWFENPLPFSYHKDAERTSRAYNDRGWVTMDDLGYLDADGYLFLRDRKSTTLTVKGATIYPRVVEDALIGVAGVRDIGVAVVGRDAGTQRLIAGYAPIADNVAIEDLNARLRQAADVLDPSHRPTGYRAVSPFPRDADGKIDRITLAQMLETQFAMESS
jgi:long-chain acyl-CoA synthetase